MAKILKAGLIGYGVSGRVFHAPFLHRDPHYELYAVAERNSDECRSRYPYVRRYKDPADLLRDPELDLVIITTPNETHMPFAREALLHGKHVVLEKPVCVRSEDMLGLIRLSGERGLVLSPYHNRRYVSDFRTLEDILRAGLLGPIVECEIHYDRYRPERRPGAWRERDIPGSGILFDLGPHLLDQALFLFGAPLTLTADIRRQRPGIETDDYFDIRLDYGWLRVILSASMLVREMGSRYMIHGLKGSYIKSGDDPQETLLRAGIAPEGPDWGLEPEEFRGILHTEREGQVIREFFPTRKGDYGAYYEDLYLALNGEAPLRVLPEDGYNTILLIEMARQSSLEQRTLDCLGLLPGSRIN